MNRTEQIKGYLKRLGDGESLENVKKDFVKEFTQHYFTVRLRKKE